MDKSKTLKVGIQFACLRACCQNKTKDYLKKYIKRKERRKESSGRCEEKKSGEGAGREARGAEERGLFYDLQQMDQKGWGCQSVPPSVI